MKISSIKTLTAFVFFVAFLNTLGLSQQSVALIPSQSEITIKGTSNVHDWEERVNKFRVHLNLNFREKEIAGIDAVQVICESGSIVSENSIMTNKTHNALNVDKYPKIEFKLVSVDKLLTENGRFSGTLVGDIILAGVTRRISLAFSGVHSGNKITIKGAKEINMSDFKIEPPTAMLGTLKTGQEVTISFQLNFQIT